MLSNLTDVQTQRFLFSSSQTGVKGDIFAFWCGSTFILSMAYCYRSCITVVLVDYCWCVSFSAVSVIGGIRERSFVSVYHHRSVLWGVGCEVCLLAGIYFCCVGNGAGVVIQVCQCKTEWGSEGVSNPALAWVMAWKILCSLRWWMRSRWLARGWHATEWRRALDSGQVRPMESAVTLLTHGAAASQYCTDVLRHVHT